MFRNCKIKITKICGYNTLLIIDKQRFICKHCNRTFTASTNVVDISSDIEKYFKRYSKQEKDKVQFITMDLYNPHYKKLKKYWKLILKKI